MAAPQPLHQLNQLQLFRPIEASCGHRSVVISRPETVSLAALGTNEMRQEAGSREGDYGFHRSKSSSILSVTWFSNEGWGRFSCSLRSSLLQRRDFSCGRWSDASSPERAGGRRLARARPAICGSARVDTITMMWEEPVIRQERLLYLSESLNPQ